MFKKKKKKKKLETKKYFVFLIIFLREGIFILQCLEKALGQN
jgi:hypothetical protein